MTNDSSAKEVIGRGSLITLRNKLRRKMFSLPIAWSSTKAYKWRCLQQATHSDIILWTI